MNLQIPISIKYNRLKLILPWSILTFLLLLHRFFQYYVMSPDVFPDKIISSGVLFSSLIWLFLLPMIFYAAGYFKSEKVLKFIVFHSLSGILIGFLHYLLFVYLHQMIWPGAIDPELQLSPTYLLQDLRLNFFIYWLLTGGFYLQNKLSLRNRNVERLRKSIRIKVNSRFIKIDPSRITYIKSLGNYVRIYLTDDMNYVTRSSLNKIEKQLPFNEFMRVQKSFIINLHQLSGYEKGSHGEYILHLQPGKKIPASRNKTSEIKDRLDRIGTTIS